MIKLQLTPTLSLTQPELMTQWLCHIFWIHWLQFPIFIDKSQSCPLLHHHHKKQKKKEKKIDDKDTFETPPATYTHGADTANGYIQDAGSTDSYLPWELSYILL